jgi:hypothetical protein
MKLKFAAAALFAVASMNAFAGDQSVALTQFQGDWVASFSSLKAADPIALSGGSDVITFTGLTSGWYDVSIGITGQNGVFAWDGANTTLNGQSVLWDSSEGGTKKIKYYLSVDSDASVSAPFVFNLAGTATAGALYDGNITITSAVPEPTTYGMLLGGLGIMGFLARRKAKKA